MNAMKGLLFRVTLPLALAVLSLPPAGFALAGSFPLRERPILVDARYDDILFGNVVDASAVRADTVYLLGGPGTLSGKFQDAGGAPDPQGWTGVDLTLPDGPFWHIDTYCCANLDPGQPDNHAWWCGTTFTEDCGTGDYNGYGNAWDDKLEWSGQVADPGSGVTVRLSAMLNHDNEPGYDYLYLEYEGVDGPQVVATWNGIGTGVAVNETFSLSPADYGGAGGDEVRLRWCFVSDSGWSDADCLYPSLGAAQIDLIEVFFDQGGGEIQIGTTETCEAGDPVQWAVAPVVGVGDFSKVWPFLDDIDPCHHNSTPQFAFIDDGQVVPGTGGYPCQDWCYGPGRYIVNPEGGLAGPDYHISNAIWSPPLAWPAGGYVGAQLEFDVWRDMTFAVDSPGILYFWRVRSTEDPTGETGWSNWQSPDHTGYYGGPNYYRQGCVVTSFLEDNPTFVQISFGVHERGWLWGWTGTNGTPAPYYDNVAFKVFRYDGPVISTREIDIAQDNFPEIGTIDYANLGANHVRFDMARNISLAAHMRNDPGDSIFCDVVPVRTGAVLNDLPKLYYKIQPGTSPDMFAAYRSIPLQGWVYGDTTYTGIGTPIADRYNFDLPDSSSLFPGDKMHYYIEGQDNVSGDIGTARLPADTTGFDNFFGYPWYSSSFTVHALPSLKSQTPGDQPPILFWNDFADRGGEQEWHHALSNLGFREGLDFDTYYTNGPSSGVGNGLGGRATASQLAGYEGLLYTCGDLDHFTISNGDFSVDPSDDVGVLDAWLRLGSKNMFLTGNDLVSDLVQNSGATGAAFVATWLSVSFIDEDIRPLIDNQHSPLVKPLPASPIGFTVDEWIAYGSCPYFYPDYYRNTFGAVGPTGGAVPLAEFTDPDGLGGAYPYAAGTYALEPIYSAGVVYLPYDLMFVYTSPDGSGPPAAWAARTAILQDILAFWGMGGLPPIGIPETGCFWVRNFPNPFNPLTRVEYNLPRKGRLSIKVYSLRGELVRTLIDEVVERGPGSVTWDGTDGAGQVVASGVYFFETVAPGERVVTKTALVR